MRRFGIGPVYVDEVTPPAPVLPVKVEIVVWLPQDAASVAAAHAPALWPQDTAAPSCTPAPHDVLVRRFGGCHAIDMPAYNENLAYMNEVRNAYLGKLKDSVTSCQRAAEKAIQHELECRRLLADAEQIAAEAENSRRIHIAKQQQLEELEAQRARTASEAERQRLVKVEIMRRQAEAVEIERVRRKALEEEEARTAKLTPIARLTGTLEEFFGFPQRLLQPAHAFRFLSEIKSAIGSGAACTGGKPPWKPLADKMRMVIKRNVGQVVNDRGSITRVVAELRKVLDATKLYDEPSIYLYMLNSMAKAVCKQAQTEAGDKVERAFPCAHVTVLLSCWHPYLVSFTLVRLYKHCPFLIPGFPRSVDRKIGQSLLLKYRLPEEPPNVCGERKNGIVSLYACLLQTKPLDTPQVQQNCSSAASQANATLLNPYMIDWGLEWLQKLPADASCRDSPRFSLTFLSIAGHACIVKKSKTTSDIVMRLWTSYQEAREKFVPCDLQRFGDFFAELSRQKRIFRKPESIPK